MSGAYESHRHRAPLGKTRGQRREIACPALSGTALFNCALSENGQIYGSIICGGIAEGEFSTTLKNNEFTATVMWQSNMAYDNDEDIPAPVQENISLRLSVYENSPSIIIYNGTESERTLYKFDCHFDCLFPDDVRSAFLP